MKLHFLGTTGYHANDTRQTACLMLPEIGVILDAGTGMYRAKSLIETDDLHIFLTHAHLDHVIGLTYLFDILAGRKTNVIVHAAESKIDAIENHLFEPNLFPIRPEFKIVPFDDQPVVLPDQSTLTTFPLEHPGGCLGFRIDWPDKSMAYVTDTTADLEAGYVEAIAEVDTLIHECYFPDGWEDYSKLTGHSCLGPVAAVAAKANVGQVYLVHINPLDEVGDSIDVKDAKSVFADMQIASDQMIIEV